MNFHTFLEENKNSSRWQKLLNILQIEFRRLHIQLTQNIFVFNSRQVKEIMSNAHDNYMMIDDVIRHEPWLL